MKLKKTTNYKKIVSHMKCTMNDSTVSVMMPTVNLLIIISISLIILYYLSGH